MTLPWPPRRIGLFGGSFDPIHNGHLAPVEDVRTRFGLDYVVFVPAFVPPHKPAGPSASAYHRFAMSALALAPFPRLAVSDFEVSRGGTTYTVETLRHLRANLPASEVLLLLGSDAVQALPSWREWREIVESYRILVIHREPSGYEATRTALPPELAARLAPAGSSPDEAPDGASVFWGGNAPVTISSTWIRRAVETGSDLRQSVPPAVEEYLRRERLYLPA